MKKSQGNKKTVRKSIGSTTRSSKVGTPKKSTQSAKNPAKKRKNLIKADFTPFILLAAALLTETCFLMTEQAGVIGELIQKLFFGLFGLSAHLIPLGLLLIAFFYKDLKSHGTLRFKLIMFPVFTVTLSVASTLIAQNGLEGAKFSFKTFWETGVLSESGGVFGGVLGMLFSAMFGGVAAGVISIVAVIAIASLSFGKTRLGVWLIFVRDKKSEGSMRDTEGAPTEPIKTTVTPKAAPKVAQIIAPRRIDTLISEEEPSLPSAPDLALLTDEPVISELLSNGHAMDEPEYSDGVSANGELTDTDEHYDGFDRDENLRASYRPADLMEDFGFRDEIRRAEKEDIYSEGPKPEPQKPLELPKIQPTAPKKQDPTEATKGYSPFATIMSREEFFSGKGAKPTYETPKRASSTSGETVAYSPFSDPIASMNAPKRDTADLPPQSYIAAGQEKIWEDMRSRNGDTDRNNDSDNDGVSWINGDPIAPIASQSVDTALPESDTVEDDDVMRIAAAFGSRSSDIGRNGDLGINEVLRTPITAQVIETPATDEFIEPTPIPPTKDELYSRDPMADFAPETSEKQGFASAFPQKNEPVQSAPITPPASQSVEPEPTASVTPIITTSSTPITPSAPEKMTPAMPLETTHSAFDDDIVAPEQEDESAASSPNADYSDERDPRVISPFSRYTKLRYPKYVKPPSSLLDEADNSKKISEEEIHAVMQKILDKFESFHVDVSITGYSAGPSITRYEVTPGPGVKYKQVTGLAEDIGLALQSDAIKGEVRIVNVPGKPVIGIEVPNSVVSKVSLRSLIENPDFQKAKSKITVCVGLTVSCKPVYMNIDDMPHVLVAGQTKSGKSVAINAMIMSLIYRASPDEVQFILVDPKQVELSIYNDIPHMAMPVIDDPKRAAGALQWAVAEMERRYTLIKNARVRDREEYYKTKDQNPDFEYMPQIIIIIDELADLMLQVREHVEEPINRLAAKARACGINLVIGTQRPSTDIVTGLIKANIPSKIAFRVASNVDSRVILGNVGAEKLLGRGDMLYHPTGSNQIRAQGAFVDTSEIKRVLDFIIDNNGSVEYDPEILYRLQSETDKLNKTDKKAVGGDDEYAVDTADIDFDYLCQAVELVINLGKATTNVIQRHLKIGFNRASNIVDRLEDLGFISKSNGSSKPRDVTVTMAEFLEWKNSHQK